MGVSNFFKVVRSTFGSNVVRSGHRQRVLGMVRAPSFVAFDGNNLLYGRQASSPDEVGEYFRHSISRVMRAIRPSDDAERIIVLALDG